MTQHDTSAGQVILEGALTIRTAEVVRATLREALERESNIAIECGDATEVDLSFVQLLIAARVSATRSGKTVALAAPPNGPLLDTLTCAGFRVVAEGASADAGAFWFAAT
jgi:anti-anti-sigma regulatory factor